MFAVLALASTLFCPLAQDPASAQVMARYTCAGKPAEITRADVALEMAFHLRRKEEGRGACDHLVGARLVQLEAQKNGIAASEDEMRAEWNELQRQYRAAGRDPRTEPVVRNSTEPELLAYFSMPVLMRKLCRKELAMKPSESVSGEMMQLWLQDARKRNRVVDDPDQLPIGTAAKVGDEALSMLDLGLLLLRTSDDEQRNHFVRQVAVLQSTEARAKQLDLAATPAELERELEARRADAAKDPRYQGISYEQLLKAQGVTPASLLQSRVFRAQLLQKKIAAAEHPETALLAELKDHRQDVLDRVGPRRKLGVIFARALDEPNELVPKTFAQAEEHLRKAKARLAKDPFDFVAAVESDDPTTKARGGDLGWFQRRDKSLPDALLAAAWALAKDGVSEPIRGRDGYYLVKVLDIEPDCADGQLLQRLRDRYAAEMTPQIVATADIRLPDGRPLDGGEDQQANQPAPRK